MGRLVELRTEAEIMTQDHPQEQSGDEVIEARAGRYYRNARYLIVLLLVGWGVWSIKDGFRAYPQENLQFMQREFENLAPENRPDGVSPEHLAHFEYDAILLLGERMGYHLPHPALDIPLNRIFGTVLPPIGVLFLAWVLYNSRGVYRMHGQTLSVPGHGEIPIDSIRGIDKSKWDKKGIAWVEYQKPGGSTGRFKLDDFVYQAEPVRKIMERIEHHAQSPQA